MERLPIEQFVSAIFFLALRLCTSTIVPVLTWTNPHIDNPSTGLTIRLSRVLVRAVQVQISHLFCFSPVFFFLSSQFFLFFLPCSGASSAQPYPLSLSLSLSLSPPLLLAPPTPPHPTPPSLFFLCLSSRRARGLVRQALVFFCRARMPRVCVHRS